MFASATRGRRPEMRLGQTIPEYLRELDEWKSQGDWIPACNCSEQPFTTRSGRRLLYVYQPRSGNHAYLDMGTDLILSPEETRLAMAL